VPIALRALFGDCGSSARLGEEFADEGDRADSEFRMHRMKARTEAWYRNPFRLGGLGMLALLGGYLVQREAAPLGQTTALSIAGRLTFLTGLVTVGIAAALWFVQAQAPEQPIEHDAFEAEPPDEDDGEDD
jgi:hypothetical protein